MPDSVMSLFPQVLNNLEALKVPLQTTVNCTEVQRQTISAGFDFWQTNRRLVCSLTRHFSGLMPTWGGFPFQAFIDFYQDAAQTLNDSFLRTMLETIDRFRQARTGELAFLDLFTDTSTRQDWTVDHDQTRVLLDLPGMRIIDISTAPPHRIRNYTVVFAPRAGHHSNIAERVALYLRERGLTQMAVVEQKCAEDIPLYINGRRHRENFDGQVDQYKSVLEFLKSKTGRAPHLVAICQPGPLLLSTLILNPGLGRTFGSAGSPMHTEAESGFLTDFARTVGENYIDRLLVVSGLRIGDDRTGAGRLTFDGRLQVLGFYLLGYDLHLRNLKHLLTDLKTGNRQGIERQQAFYQWYNSVHHFPVGFIKDTFKKIFIQNSLIRGKLQIGGRRVGIADYPASVPVWALGGLRDNIAPPLQATGHMELITSVAPEKKLTLKCDGGHMGLFRSHRTLKQYYTKIAAFMLSHSDRSP